MYLTGFADEAASDIEVQIKATKELGWEYIEARSINDKNIHDISDKEFDNVYEVLLESGIKINCFGSAIANWGKQIDKPFDSSLDEARRAIPRMKRLGTKLVRIMSFAVLQGREPDDQMEEERFSRLRIIQKMFADEGLTAVHENCMNYGGMSWKHTLRLVENVPDLKLVFDTGNPVFSNDYSKAEPYPKQSAWEFYSQVKKHIAYIHVKDGYMDNINNQAVFTFPGEGDGDVKKIIADLLMNGYDGGFSIEPHLAVVFHDKEKKSSDEIRYFNYVEYGRRLMRLIDEIKHDAM